MKKRLATWVSLSFLACLVTGIIIVTQGGILTQYSQAFEPTKIEPCLPKVDLKKVFERHQIGSTKFQKKRYFLYALIENKAVPPFDDWYHKDTTYTIVSADEIGCLVEMPSEESFKLSWSEYIPQKAARDLALAELTYQIKQYGGVEPYLKSLVEANFGETSSDPFYFFSEQVWAFQQLKIKVPEPYEIIRDTSSLFDESYSPMFD